jgi:hypothetical protein
MSFIYLIFTSLNPEPLRRGWRDRRERTCATNAHNIRLVPRPSGSDVVPGSLQTVRNRSRTRSETPGALVAFLLEIVSHPGPSGYQQGKEMEEEIVCNRW